MRGCRASSPSFPPPELLGCRCGVGPEGRAGGVRACVGPPGLRLKERRLRGEARAGPGACGFSPSARGCLVSVKRSGVGGGRRGEPRCRRQGEGACPWGPWGEGPRVGGDASSPLEPGNG